MIGLVSFWQVIDLCRWFGFFDVMEVLSDIKINLEILGFEFMLWFNCGLLLIEIELIDFVMEDGW